MPHISGEITMAVNPTRSNNSILGGLRQAVSDVAQPSSATAGTATDAKAERPKSQFWLNIGFTIPGGAEDGSDLFVSLPQGIALDDMKPQEIRGSNQNWIQLLQAKNHLLEQLQKGGAELEPGARITLEGFTVEMHRVGTPAQQGDANSNPIIGAMAKIFGG
jgi:hypothetical protein